MLQLEVDTVFTATNLSQTISESSYGRAAGVLVKDGVSCRTVVHQHKVTPGGSLLPQFGLRGREEDGIVTV